jgi:hypothetical protein
MKPFNLEEAKAGKPVCTRNGREVRILCFDYKEDARHPRPIVAILKYRDCEKEELMTYTKEGKSLPSYEEEHSTDLMMVSEKKDGWINIYKVGSMFNGGGIYSSKEEAIEKSDSSIVSANTYITTIKIEWEE